MATPEEEAAASAAQAAASAADASKSAEEAKKAVTPPDPEATWPPRFVPRSLLTAGLMLALLFLALTGFFREVFDGAGLLTNQKTGSNVAAYVLFEIGLLALLAGLFFALVEARTPPPPPPPAPPPPPPPPEPELERVDVPSDVAVMLGLSAGEYSVFLQRTPGGQQPRILTNGGGSPPPDVPPKPTHNAVTQAADAASAAFSGRAMSRVLLAIGLTLITLAAAASGLVNLSVGDAPAAVTPTETPSEPPSS